jgi:polysaccharide deacetylase 2 family uncharacterized protein YibQ
MSGRPAKRPESGRRFSKRGWRLAAILVFSFLALTLAACNRGGEGADGVGVAGQGTQLLGEAAGEVSGQPGAVVAFAVTRDVPKPGLVNRARLPAGVEGHPEAVAALPFFAKSISAEAWQFPSGYHYHEWRTAVGLRTRPTELTVAGRKIRLGIAKPAPRIVILIDDLGHARWALQKLAGLGYPINGAILPHTPHARLAVELLRSTQGDAILHLPLEPMGYPRDDPGKGALLVTMPTESQRVILAANWASVPGVRGFNNHMGSRYTSDAVSMALLAVETQGQPFFVDSRTHPRSRAQAQMVLHGIPALGRTHFLDEENTDEAVSERLDEAIAYARRNGVALAIGHPNLSTLRVLAEAGPRLAAAGVTPVALTDIFREITE